MSQQTGNPSPQELQEALDTLRAALAFADTPHRWHGSGAIAPEEIPANRSAGDYLKNWREILAALDRKNNRAEKRFVAALNRQFAGPIVLPGRGGQPKVEKNRLIAWWNHLEILWETLGRGENTEANVAAQYKHGRNEVVFPEISGHVKRKREAS